MSQERRRRRAQQRTAGRHHGSSGKRSSGSGASSGVTPAQPRQKSAKPGRTALQQRKHNLVVLLGIVVVAVNVLAFFVTDNWDHRLLVLVISIVGATVAYFLAANPAKSTGV